MAWLKVVVELLALCYFILHSSKNQLIQMSILDDLDTGPAPPTNKTFHVNSDGTFYEYDRYSKLVFIGGVSGVKGLANLLDLHPDIRCGEQTEAVANVLMTFLKWSNSLDEEQLETSRATLDDALATFVLEFIARYQDAAPVLCHQHPLLLQTGVFLKQLFPNSKTLNIVRDGRSMVHTALQFIPSANSSHYRENLQIWNSRVKVMTKQCQAMGSDHCLQVYYEQLVLHPKLIMNQILDFLQLPEFNFVLKDYQFFQEKSIFSWQNQLPKDVVKDMKILAPMLEDLDYDPNDNWAKYSKLRDEL